MTHPALREHIWVHYVTTDPELAAIHWCRDCGAHRIEAEGTPCPATETGYPMYAERVELPLRGPTQPKGTQP